MYPMHWLIVFAIVGVFVGIPYSSTGLKKAVNRTGTQGGQQSK